VQRTVESKRNSQLRVPDSSKPSATIQLSNKTAERPRTSDAPALQHQQRQQDRKTPVATRLVVPTASGIGKQSLVLEADETIQSQAFSVEPPSSSNDSTLLAGGTIVKATVAPTAENTAVAARETKICHQQPKQQAISSPKVNGQAASGSWENKPLQIDAPNERQTTSSKEQRSDSSKSKLQNDTPVIQNSVPERVSTKQTKENAETNSKSSNKNVSVQELAESEIPSSSISVGDLSATRNKDVAVAAAQTQSQSSAVAKSDSNAQESQQKHVEISKSQQTLTEQTTTSVASDQTSGVNDKKTTITPSSEGAKASLISPVVNSENVSAKQGILPDAAVVQEIVYSAAIDNDIPSDDAARWQARCLELESQLRETQDKLLQSEQLVWEKEQQSEQQRQELMVKFQEKELRLLQASNEDHQQELEQMRQDSELLCQSLQQQMEQERNMALQQQQQLSRLLNEAESRVENADESKKAALSKMQTEFTQVQQRQKRSIQMAEDKLAQALAKLDERDEEIKKLKTTVSSLQSKMTKHQEGAQEAEEEMDELHSENETLRQHVQVLQEECTKLRAHVEELEADAEKFSGLQVSSDYSFVSFSWCHSSYPVPSYDMTSIDGIENG
jgi:hypothetical protein